MQTEHTVPDTSDSSTTSRPWLLKLPLRRRWIVFNPASRLIATAWKTVGLALALVLLAGPPAVLVWGLVSAARFLHLPPDVAHPVIVVLTLVSLVAGCRLRLGKQLLIHRLLDGMSPLMWPFTPTFIEIPVGQHARARRRRRVRPRTEREHAQQPEWEFFEFDSPGLYLMKPGVDVFFIGTSDDWDHFEPLGQ